MSKSSPCGLSRGERRRINQHLEYLDQRPIADSEEATIAGATRLAAGLRDASSVASLAITFVPIAVAVVVGGASTDAGIAVVLIGFLFAAALMGLVVIISKGQVATAEAARVIVMHRVDVARQTGPQQASEEPASGLVSWFRKGRGKRS